MTSKHIEELIVAALPGASFPVIECKAPSLADRLQFMMRSEWIRASIPLLIISLILFHSIDCDYPVECDDEYWEAENPADAFKQPPGKPSYAAAFTYTLKLMEIIGFMSRTLYSTKKSRILSGVVGEEWEQRVVTELDSSLNKWKDSLPAHRKPHCFLGVSFKLPHRSDRKFFLR